ncbi:MAG: hypothetical protein Q9227_001542 [Pyrenula ochraceoflavens]
MDTLEDEDSFSDGAFDDLAPSTLLELENNAFQATQKLTRPIEPANLYKPQGQRWPIGETNQNPGFARELENYKAQDLRDDENYNHYEGQGPGFEEGAWVRDAEVSTPVEEKTMAFPPAGEMTQREQWRLNRFGQVKPTSRYPEAPPARPINPRYAAQASERALLPRRFAAPAPVMQGDTERHGQDDEMMIDDQNTHIGPPASSVNEEALRAQLEELLEDRDRKAKELENATTTILAQKGEIAIVRANQDDASKTFDRRFAALKKSIEEDATKHRAELEAVNLESKRVFSENQFLRHNLSEEVDRVKSLRRNLKEKSKDGHSPVSTPKKSRTLPLRDGFNDAEIFMRSPVKSGRRSGPTTPSAGNKRKRKPTVTSPTPALDISQDIVEVPKKTEVSHRAPSELPSKPQVVVLQDSEGLDFMQKLLNHHISFCGKRLLEVFTELALPSNKKQSFSSIYLGQTTCLTGKGLPAGLTKVILSLWSRSLNEKYFEPLPIFTDVMGFILSLHSTLIAPFVIEDLLKVLQHTIELNGIPRFNHSPVSHHASGKSKHTPKSELVAVDETACLEMLYTAACACVHTEKHIKYFWQTVNPDLVLMMLNSSQLIPNIVFMLDILSTSILGTTFGTIVASETDQAAIEKHIVNRITWLLWETPRVDEGDEPYTKAEICDFRLEVMSLLSLLAFGSPHPHNDDPNEHYHHSSALLARHPTALARIFRCMYDSLDFLYTHPPEHDLFATLVNEGTRIVHHLLQVYGNEIDLSQKLNTINGGVQKHRVVLTRLAFSEGLLLEEGITDETVVMAHDMLEQAVTPEEAEALMDVFHSSKGSKGSSS